MFLSQAVVVLVVVVVMVAVVHCVTARDVEPSFGVDVVVAFLLAQSTDGGGHL